MNAARVRIAVGTGVLSTIGVALVSVGVKMISEGEMIAGGILVAVGTVLLIAADYMGR